MFLCDEDIVSLTGFKFAKKQIEWLRTNQINFRVNGIGKPVVLKSYIEEILGKGKPKKKGKTQPNYAALEELQRSTHRNHRTDSK